MTHGDKLKCNHIIGFIASNLLEHRFFLSKEKCHTLNLKQTGEAASSV